MKNHKWLVLAGCLWASSLLAQTAEDYLTQGRADLEAHDLTGADSNFNAAVTLSPTNETANALAAATRLLVLPRQPAGSNFLNSLRFSTSGRDLYNWTSTLPTNAGGDTVFPTNNTSMMIAFYRTNIMAALAASRTNLARITNPAFTLSLNASETSIESVTLDYGDILLLRAMLYGAEFVGYTANAHNFNVVISHLHDLGETNGLTIQKVLADYPSLLSQSSLSDLTNSKTAFTNAIILYQQASDFIRNARPADVTRLFNLGTGDLAAEARFRDFLARTLSSVTAPAQLNTNGPALLYAGAYFAQTDSLRNLVPQFTDNRYINNTLPDYTFGGVLLDEPACDTESFLRRMSGHSFQGMYIGDWYDYYFNFLGRYAVLIRPNQQATAVGYGKSPMYGIFMEFMVNNQGQWEFETNGMQGTVYFYDDDTFGGEVDSSPGIDELYGRRQPTSGSFQQVAGLYTGTWASTNFTPRQSGTLSIIVTADGQVFYCAFDSTGLMSDGGYGHFQSANYLQVPTGLGATVNGTLNLNSLKLTGGFMSASGMGGTNTLSRSANVPIDDQPPTLTLLPEKLTVLLGTNVSLAINATGSPPLCCQWFSNHVAIPKATNSTLVISNVQWSSEGTYYGVTVRNCAGETNTATMLHVSLAVPNTVHSFQAFDSGDTVNADGAIPFAGLVLSNGTLYGTTVSGGQYACGTVFKVNTNGSNYAVLHPFDIPGGSDPSCRLALSGSMLYGTTPAYGGYYSSSGNVFMLRTNASSINDIAWIHTFYDADGSDPEAGLVVSGTTLYGTAGEGGTNGLGIVFKMNTNGTFATLHTFTGETDGANPYASLVLSGSTLYGTASVGGTNGFGTVFKMDTNGNGYAVLHTFNNADGAYPYADLILAGNTLYGTTYGDGTNGFGTVFKLNTDGSGYIVLHNFSAEDPNTSTNADGAHPDAGLVLSGNTLYGTTWEGGNSGYGVVFSVSTDGSVFNTLYCFAGNPDGANPAAELTLSGTTVYGTTAYGGAYGNGTVFSMQIPPSPPVLTAQPQNLTVSGGNSATFGAEASGTTPLFYQWRKDGANLTNSTHLSGTTSSLLRISGTLTNDAGSYTLVVTNAYGMATSSNAVLTVIPTNHTFWLPDYYYPIHAGNVWEYDSIGTGEGSKMICSVDATSVAITDYIGCSPPVLVLRNAIRLYNAYGDDGTGGTFNPVDAWYEYHTVDPGWGMPGSDDIPGPDQMRVNPGILITNRMTVGQSLSTNLQVYANGACNGQMTFQFQLVEVTSLTVPAGTYPECLHLKYAVILTGGTSSEYQTNQEWWAKGVGMVKKTRHAVKSGEVQDEQFDLSRTSFVIPPRIITPPQSLTNSIGTAASFSVEAMGTDPLYCLWQKNGTNLSDGANIFGSTSTNLVIANVQFADAGSYSVVVSNAYGSVTSTPPAALTVKDTTPPALAITSHTNLQLLGVSAITLAGTASDAGTGDNGIASVTVNGIRATNNMASGSATASWSRGLVLSLGANTISVIATDTRTNSATNVIHIISDTARPTNAITAPTSGQRWSNLVFAVTGTVKDNVAVSTVWYQLNGVAWSNALTANGWTNWTASVTLQPGTNILKAYAVDTVGNLSITNSVNLDYVVTNQLQVRLTGRGTLSPNYSNTWLEIGRNYNVTSTPAGGFSFTNWVVSTNWAGGTTKNTTNLPFMMASNLTLQANFLDVARPTNTITAPGSGQKLTNAMTTVKGTASDNDKVAAVFYQLNTNVWAMAGSTNGWTNWTATVTLLAGTNKVKAYTVDAAGNVSTTNSVSFVSPNAFQLSLGCNPAQTWTSNGLGLIFNVSTGVACRIEVSTNLLNWTTLTNFFATNATINLRDISATNYQWRFYRATTP